MSAELTLPVSIYFYFEGYIFPCFRVLSQRNHTLYMTYVLTLVKKKMQNIQKKLSALALIRTLICIPRQNHLTIVKFSPEQSALQRELKEFLFSHLYNHYKVIKMCNKARRYIEALFNIYIKDPRQLPPDFSRYENKYQAVCDYIAGMTDRFAQDEYERLFMPYTKM